LRKAVSQLLVALIRAGQCATAAQACTCTGGSDRAPLAAAAECQQVRGRLYCDWLQPLRKCKCDRCHEKMQVATEVTFASKVATCRSKGPKRSVQRSCHYGLSSSSKVPGERHSAASILISRSV
jgi:hypothetical protein